MKRVVCMLLVIVSCMYGMENKSSARNRKAKKQQLAGLVPVIKKPSTQKLLPAQASAFEEVPRTMRALVFDPMKLIEYSCEFRSITILHHQSLQQLQSAHDEKMKQEPSQNIYSPEYAVFILQQDKLTNEYRAKQAMVYAKLQKIAAEVAVKKRVDVILSKSEVWYVNPAYDVTGEIFNQLNEEFMKEMAKSQEQR